MQLVDRLRIDFMSIADHWVGTIREMKRIPAGTLGEAEEWVGLALVMRALRTLRKTLSDIEATGRPQLPGALTTRADGQVVARVFPREPADRVIFRGFSGEVWMEPDTTVQEALDTEAQIYAAQDSSGKVSLVLGVGNGAFLNVIDALNKLFGELQVVILKVNPVNEYIGPLLAHGFSALIERGFLRIVYGGAEQGDYLCRHPLVAELHMTGSAETFEAITFGRGEAGRARKAANEPINTRRFTAELGNVSPVIIVPGPWSPQDITKQAVQLASWMTVNSGYGCLTPRVLIQHRAWDKRTALLDEVERTLADVDTRYAYYPGSAVRHDKFVSAHPEAAQLGQPTEGQLPWTLIRDVDPLDGDDIVFRREAWCGLAAETALPAESIPGYIDRAVRFANDVLWGSLCATLIVHPRSMKDPRIAAAVEQAIADLRYGSVSVNAFVFYSAYLTTTPWGGFPGHTIGDIQSGIGKSYNFLMFGRPEKSVLRAPFERLDPITVNARRPHRFAKKLASYEYEPSVGKLPGLLWAALRS